MMNSLWIAKTGMTAQQTQLDVISHNLANVSTTGFKRNRAEFQDLIYQNLRQVGAQTTEENQLPTGLHLGLGVNVVATSRNFTQGGLQQSGNNLDVARWHHRLHTGRLVPARRSGPHSHLRRPARGPRHHRARGHEKHQHQRKR